MVNGDPVTDLDGSVVQPITTSINGFYNFSKLPSGDYGLQVTPPEGYVPAPTAADADPDSNPVNDDSNGAIAVQTRSVRSPVITLTPGSEPTIEGDADLSGTLDAAGNMTVDFGFYHIMSLGNRIWFDDGADGGISNNGVIDGGELGVAGILVHLLDADRNPVLGADGLFAALGAGVDPLELYIWLVEVENTGNELTYGPVRVHRVLKSRVFLPLIGR